MTVSVPAELPEIPQRELRNEVSRVLREVSGGVGFTITVDGTPVADLVPHRSRERRRFVPSEEVKAAFAHLPTLVPHDGSDQIDDTWYDPYDRAYRRGEFAPREGS